MTCRALSRPLAQARGSCEDCVFSGNHLKRLLVKEQALWLHGLQSPPFSRCPFREARMFRRWLLASAGVVAVAAAVAGVAPTAAASEARPSRMVLRDGTGDVWAFRTDGASSDWTREARPSADVVRAVVRHGPHAVRVRVRFLDLRRVGLFQSVRVSISADDGETGEFSAWVLAQPHARGGEALWEESGSGRDPVTCEGLRHRINYASNVVRVRVPRACMRFPESVQVAVSNELETSSTVYVDNPHNDQPYPGVWPSPLYTPGGH